MRFSPITADTPLILASASPRRKQLLEQIGLPFLQVNSNTPEELFHGTPHEDAGRLATEKARTVLMMHKGHWILGADTMVVLEGRILGKPSGPQDAGSMLRLLGGREHRVITGISLLNPEGRVSHIESVVTIVRMKGLTEEEIQAYISTGEHFGKAGSYAIQGIGAFMVESIEGSYSNVVGLPLCALVKAMVRVKALENFP